MRIAPNLHLHLTRIAQRRRLDPHPHRAPHLRPCAAFPLPSKTRRGLASPPLPYRAWRLRSPAASRPSPPSHIAQRRCLHLLPHRAPHIRPRAAFAPSIQEPTPRHHAIPSPASTASIPLVASAPSVLASSRRPLSRRRRRFGHRLLRFRHHLLCRRRLRAPLSPLPSPPRPPRGAGVV